MTIPGFSAEASLLRGGRYYRSHRLPSGPRFTQQVNPAVLVLIDGVEWGQIPGSVYGIIGWDDGGGSGGGGGGGAPCRCLEWELVCSPIINCVPGGDCGLIQDCSYQCRRQECWI
jgi:hypothetical protein